MKVLNACVVLASSCLALLGGLSTAAGRLGSSVEHPFDDMYEGAHQYPEWPPALNRAA